MDLVDKYLWLEDMPLPIQNEILRTCEDVMNNTWCDSNHVLRWASNDRVPPQEIVRLAKYLGANFDVKETYDTRESELNEMIQDYKANYIGPSPEVRAEARAVHGPGVELVDVISGYRWTT